jgi:hypothetical protein
MLRRKLSLIQCLMAIAIIGVVIALVVPAQPTRDRSWPTMVTAGSLTEIGRATKRYASANAVFPAAAMIDKKGRPLLTFGESAIEVVHYVAKEGKTGYPDTDNRRPDRDYQKSAC